MSIYAFFSNRRMGLLLALLGSFPLMVESAIAVEETRRPESSVVTPASEPSVLAGSIASAEPIPSVAEVLETSAQISVSGLVDEMVGGSPLDQVTSVTQLSDVRPTDWAFQALSRLIENYGCIAGYPDGTYRGNRPLTRYEFAAGLNACLDAISERIGTGISREDLDTIRRLQQEFQAELATLRGRVDALEARTSELEANQFSTTTRLNGEVIFSFAGAGGSYPGSTDADATPAILSPAALNGDPGTNPNIVFNQRTRLNLTTSFTNGSTLITGLQSFNFLGDPSSLQGSLGYSDVLGLNSSQVRLGVEPQFSGVDPRRLTARSANSVDLYKLLYIFPSGIRNLTLFAGTNAETSDAFPAISPFAGEGQGSISRFGQYNAAFRVSGGTSGTGLAAAVGLIWNPAPAFDFRALYGSVNAFLPQNNPLDLASFTADTATPLGAGFFSGSTIAAAQLTIRPAPTLDIGLNYANSYHQINILGTGLAAADIGSVLFAPGAAGSDRCATVGAFASADGLCAITPGSPTGQRGPTLIAIGSEPIRMNSIGATLTWRFAPKVSFTTSGAFLFADLVNVNASTTFTSWMVGLHARDLLGAGSSAGILFGQPLYRSSTGGSALRRLENATPYHLEGYVNFRVSDNISITPGVFFVFNPEGFSGNPTATVGVVRTTFTF